MNAQIELRRAQERLIQNPDVILSATDCRLLAFLKGIIDEVKIVGLSKEQMEKACSIDPSFRDVFLRSYAEMTALQTLEWEQHGQPATPGKFRSISSGEYYSRLAEFQTVSAIIRALERPLREAAQDTAQINYGHTAILQGTALDNSLRCRASVNKELHRATGELERLQRQRLGDNVPPPLKMI